MSPKKKSSPLTLKIASLPKAIINGWTLQACHVQPVNNTLMKNDFDLASVIFNTPSVKIEIIRKNVGKKQKYGPSKGIRTWYYQHGTAQI
jgi:hypothetical protein